MAPKIVAFGEVMMRLSVPEYLKLEQAKTLEVSYAGTGVNVLSALSKFDNDVAMITRLPTNSVGAAASAYLASLNISKKYLTRGGDYLGKYFLETGFDVRPTKVTYTNREESSFCTSQIEDYDFDAIFKEVDIVHFCGITLAISEQTRNLVLHAAEKAVENNVKVAFDFNYRPKLWGGTYENARPYYEKMLSFANICFMTERDAECLLGLSTNKTERVEKIEALLPKVASDYDVELIAGTVRNILTANENTIQGFVCFDGKLNYSQTYTFKILDRIGGGDGYASGIIHAYAHAYPIPEMVEFAAASGVLAHTTVGDAPISSIEDIKSFLTGSQGEIER